MNKDEEPLNGIICQPNSKFCFIKSTNDLGILSLKLLRHVAEASINTKQDQNTNECSLHVIYTCNANIDINSTITLRCFLTPSKEKQKEQHVKTSFAVIETIS
ncbi:CLUMA_CG015954, isoform A [Clunio marinus]|uniref:CLUMA_CG015954, isoform A n=1 Tax=Clunio marinus TaxID=568069 RepID=A0A1J1ITN1_9DIPT|nr:CLUMA_CG015954, isoform A [Clunio marinus]